MDILGHRLAVAAYLDAVRSCKQRDMSGAIAVCSHCRDGLVVLTDRNRCAAHGLAVGCPDKEYLVDDLGRRDNERHGLAWTRSCVFCEYLAHVGDRNLIRLAVRDVKRCDTVASRRAICFEWSVHSRIDVSERDGFSFHGKTGYRAPVVGSDLDCNGTCKCGGRKEESGERCDKE